MDPLKKLLFLDAFPYQSSSFTLPCAATQCVVHTTSQDCNSLTLTSHPFNTYNLSIAWHM